MKFEKTTGTSLKKNILLEDFPCLSDRCWLSYSGLTQVIHYSLLTTRLTVLSSTELSVDLTKSCTKCFLTGSDIICCAWYIVLMDLQLLDTLAFPLDILEYEIWNPWTEVVYHGHHNLILYRFQVSYKAERWNKSNVCLNEKSPILYITITNCNTIGIARLACL